MNIGIVGCGNISETYFECQKIYNNFKIIACADINNEAASNAASKYNVKALSCSSGFCKHKFLILHVRVKLETAIDEMELSV